MGKWKEEETIVRRILEREITTDAIRLVTLSNRSVKQVTEELDSSKSTLSNWLYKSRQVSTENGRHTLNLSFDVRHDKRGCESSKS